MSARQADASVRALEQRLDRARSGTEYETYLTVRDRMAPMLTDGSADDGLGEWRATAEDLDYVLDAGPLVVDRLDRHLGSVTGLRPADYRAGGAFVQQIVERRAALIAAAGDSDELLVPQPRSLGGFGFEIEGDLHNAGTLATFESMIALDRGAVLRPAAGEGGRRVVWEIGAGAGEFTHAFKTLFPDTTCIVSDLPELLLLAAVRLMSAFPDAAMVFHDGGGSEIVPAATADFVFVPLSATEQLRPGRLDLTVNTGSFGQMPGAAVDNLVAHVHAQDCPFLYTRGPAERPAPAFETAQRLYWAHPIDVLASSEHRHLIGWWSRAPR